MKGKDMWEFWNTCLWWIWAFPLQKEYFVCVLGESTLRLPQPDPLKRSDWWEWEKTLSPWCSNKQSSAHLKFTTSSISRSLSRISCNTSRRRKLSWSITACSRSSTMKSRLRSHLFCDFRPCWQTALSTVHFNKLQYPWSHLSKLEVLELYTSAYIHFQWWHIIKRT